MFSFLIFFVLFSELLIIRDQVIENQAPCRFQSEFLFNMFVYFLTYTTFKGYLY